MPSSVAAARSRWLYPWLTVTIARQWVRLASVWRRSPTPMVNSPSACSPAAAISASDVHSRGIIVASARPSSSASMLRSALGTVADCAAYSTCHVIASPPGNREREGNVDQHRSGLGQGYLERWPDFVGGLYAHAARAKCLRHRGKVWCHQVRRDESTKPPLLVHPHCTITAVIAHDDHDVGPGLDSGRQLRQGEHQRSVATQRDNLPLWKRHFGANGHRQAAAQRAE